MNFPQELFYSILLKLDYKDHLALRATSSRLYLFVNVTSPCLAQYQSINEAKESIPALIEKWFKYDQFKVKERNLKPYHFSPLLISISDSYISRQLRIDSSQFISNTSFILTIKSCTVREITLEECIELTNEIGPSSFSCSALCSKCHDDPIQFIDSYTILDNIKSGCKISGMSDGDIGINEPGAPCTPPHYTTLELNGGNVLMKGIERGRGMMTIDCCDGVSDCLEVVQYARIIFDRWAKK